MASRIKCERCGSSELYCYAHYFSIDYKLRNGYLCSPCFQTNGGTMIKLVSNVADLQEFKKEAKSLLFNLKKGK